MIFTEKAGFLNHKLMKYWIGAILEHFELYIYRVYMNPHSKYQDL